MSSNSLYSMSLFCMDIKNHHQPLVSRFWGLIGTSFRYLESFGKCNEAYQSLEIIE